MSAKDAPDLIETLSQTIDSLSSVEASDGSFGTGVKKPPATKLLQVSVNDEGSGTKFGRGGSGYETGKLTAIYPISSVISCMIFDLIPCHLICKYGMG